MLSDAFEGEISQFEIGELLAGLLKNVRKFDDWQNWVDEEEWTDAKVYAALLLISDNVGFKKLSKKEEKLESDIFYLIGYKLYSSEFYIQTNDCDKAMNILQHYDGFNGFTGLPERIDKPLMLYHSWWF
jgi:hypothetical protein